MRYIGFIFALCLSIQAIASNTLSISSVSGTPQTEVEVVVSLDNTDAITALEMVLPLGEYLSYVANSAVLTTARSNGHQVSAAQVGQDLRIYIYSLSLNALQGNSGELLTFRLLLGNEPADYALTPTVVLSDAQGTSIAGSVQAGNVTIQAPKLQIVNPQIDYGHIPIREAYTQDLQLYNAGNLPLIIENIVVNDPAFTPAQTALTIEVGEVAYTTIHYAPTVRGAIQKEVVVTSNAINGDQVATIIADPFSVNELHVGSASGIADSIVTISLTMNNMEPIVAMQCAFVLPEQLEYVANSLQPNAVRTNGHQVLSTLRSDTLFLAIFSMSNQPLHANDGEIATFQIRLNGNSGSYGLYPQDVVLSNITEENMVSATYEGWVTIQSPQLYGDDYLSFGDCPITDTAIATYSFNNYGDAPLRIERVTFFAEGYHVVTPLPLVVSPWEEGSLQIAYDPKSEGDFSTTMNLYTNDPTNRLKAIALSGHVYEPNSLTIEGTETSDGKYQLAISLDNYTDIVALQYDIHWRSDMTTSQAAFTPTARLQNHSYSIVRMDVDTYRVLIYSLVNSPIIGSSGELHQLIFTPQGEANYCDNVITIDNIVLSNSNGTDKVSESTISYYTPSTQYVEEMQTAYNQYIWHNRIYNESGTYIDTLQTITGCDSIVTLHLTINIYIEENVIACDSYTWHGETYTESGDYEYRTTLENGCERVEILHLTINHSEREAYWETTCDAYEWHGETYTESGVYEYRTTTEQGCERVEVLHLTIYNSQYEEYWETACEEYWWHGNQYTESGEYTYSYPIYDWGTGTCDRTEVLHLTINKRDTVHYYETACDEYFWNQNWQYYYESGDYKNYTTNEYGCEHVEILHLTINRSKREEYWIKTCDTYEWHGNTYTESGVYEYRTTTKQGCEHVEVLHLAINRSEREEYDVTACDQYEWHGDLYTESGVYEYRTNNTETEKLYVGYDSEHDPIIGLTPPRGISRFTVDGFITNGSGSCFVGTGSPENGIVDDEGDLRIFDAGCFYYDRMSGRHDCFFDDFRYPFNIEFGNYYAKNLETGAYYFDEGNNVYEYSNTEYPLTLFYKDYGKIHKVQFFDNNNLLWADINAVLEDGVPMITIDYYNPDGTIYYTQQFTENLYAETKTICSCGRVEILHLTINNTQYAEETVTACDNYTWNGETYTESGEYTYTTTAANGCDSIVTLHLTINQSEVGDIEDATICYGETYTWNGQTYAATGEYSVTLTNAAGCDSIATLHLTIMPEAVTSTETVVIGSDELPYTWRGNTYLATGRYTDIEQYTQVDCDSAIHVLDLTVLTTGNFDEESITICETETPYMWYGESYTATGKYTYTKKYTGTDIDSVQHILNLTVNPTKYTEETITACDSYTWNGNTYTASGEYVYTTTAANGCDSIVTLHLTINMTQYAEETVVACDGYTWNGETYTESGEYVYTTAAANGCDSIVTLHLTINKTQYAEETVTACDSYVWNGERYTASGEYTYTTTAANGCDSIVTLHLTINKSEREEYTAVVCDEYIWNGVIYTESGDYTYTTTTAAGCERVEVLHLTINKSEHVEFTETACDSYVWNGVTYTESGDYTYTTTTAAGCERVEVLHLTINKSEHIEETVTACDEYYWDHNGETYYESGDYEYYTTTEQGCERVEVLHLTILPVATTESEEIALCPSELPYEWYGQWLTEEGTYSATEQYVGMECDSVIHELTLNVYVQTLPAAVTLPIVRTGEAIDVTTPTAEIQAHIAAKTWYAPNAEVAWYIMDNSDWAALSADPVATGITEVTLKYVVDTDCGNVESDKMVINLKTTDMENTQSQSTTSNCRKVLYEDHIYILREDKIYNAMGQEL